MPRHTRVRTRLVCPIVALSTCIFTITALPGLTTLYRSSHVQLQGLGTLLHIPVSSRPPPDDVRVEIQILPSNVCFFAIPPPPDDRVEIRIVHPIDVKRLLFLRSRSALGEVPVAVVAGTTFEPTAYLCSHPCDPYFQQISCASAWPTSA